MLMCCCVCLGQDVFLSCVLSQGSVDQVLMLFVVFLCSTEVYREDVFCVKHVTNALCCVVVFIYGRMCSCDLSCVLCQTSDHQDCRHNTTANTTAPVLKVFFCLQLRPKLGPHQLHCESRYFSADIVC